MTRLWLSSARRILTCVLRASVTQNDLTSQQAEVTGSEAALAAAQTRSY